LLAAIQNTQIPFYLPTASNLWWCRI